MSTIVEKTADGTIYRAAKTYPVPNLDVLTLLFGMCCALWPANQLPVHHGTTKKEMKPQLS